MNKNNNKNRLSQSIDKPYLINPKLYHWTYHTVRFLLKFLKLNIHARGDEKNWQLGDIFLFNHFARFETVIPQFLIYEKTGQYTRSIASKELFKKDNLLTRYLAGLGGIPNNADSLMYRVAIDILKQHKLVAFPEGGIVKDRRVLNKKGEYRIFSRSHGERRKHHTGTAVIALAISIFKASVRISHNKGDHQTLQSWAKELGFDSTKELIALSEKPTLIIPCCITFYPIRVADNALKQAFHFFFSRIKKRMSEELLIEGNLLLKDTDMDIQLGKPIVVEEYWTRWENKLLMLFTNTPLLSLSDLLNVDRKEKTRWSEHLFKASRRRNINQLRDAYMVAMYDSLTINIAHIASTVINDFITKGEKRINCQKLHSLIYLCIKDLQKKPHLTLHSTLIKPTIYRSVLSGNSKNFKQFLRTIYAAELMLNDGENYVFQHALLKEYDFDEVRYENPICVYANEAAPIPEIKEALQNSLVYTENLNCEDFADKLFDDQIREYQLDFKHYQQDEFKALNAKQSMLLPSEPFRLIPDKHNAQCVVLTHGLLSSPGEMRTLADKLASLGFIVLGVRLKGHATSPWDLHTKSWQDWLESVEQTIKIARCYSSKIHLVGFSSGSLLNLYLANNSHISSITACATPVLLLDPLVKLSKIAATTNKLISSISNSQGLYPFKENNPDHPQLNYKSIPIHAISELLSLVDKTKEKLNKIATPTLLIQADNDPVVDPKSLAHLLNNIPKQYREYQWVNSNRHGILHENTDNCQQHIIDFIVKHSK